MMSGVRVPLRPPFHCPAVDQTDNLRSHGKADRLPRILLASIYSLLMACPQIGRADGDTYFSLYSGDSTTQHSNLHILNGAKGTDVTFHGVAWNTDPLDPTIYYGIRLGMFDRRHPHWGVELNYTH